MTPEDKIVAAIERNTEAIDKFRREVGYVGVWLWLIFTVLFIVMVILGGSAARAAVLLPPLEQPAFVDIGTPPAPPANPNLQYWYTMDVPTSEGVFPVEVFAPRLVANMASDPGEVVVETPEPRAITYVLGALVLLVARQWAEGKEPKR